MSIQSEPNWAGEAFVKQPGEHGYEAVTVISGQTLKCDTVVGKIDRGIGGLTIPAVVPTGTANGVMSALFAGPKITEGTYVFTCITEAANAGTFSVVGPNGALPNLTVAVAYVSEEICCTIADGSNDYDLGDTFTVTVAAGTTAPIRATGSADGTLTALALQPDAKNGRYRIAVTGAVSNGGVVQVTGPDGDVTVADSITAGAGGTLAFSTRQISGTVTDGSTDFAKGDAFEVAVFRLAAPKVAAWTPRPTAHDGRQKVAGVLRYAVDASGGDAAGVIANGKDDPVLNGSKLAWLSTLSVADQWAGKRELEKLGFVVAAAA